MRLLKPQVSKALGWLALVSLVVLTLFGLWGAPPDGVQGDAQRLMYLHVPAAWIAYLAFGVTALGSALWLWPRTRATVWDRVAGASAELGVIFTALTLVLGSLWGRPVWGVWWAWDARLVTTAVLFFLYLGYLALRRIPAAPEARAKRCAIAALIAFVDVPIVHFSVTWWRTLHQQGTVFNESLDAKIHGVMAFTLWFGVLAFTLLFVYLLDRRYRLLALEEDREDREVEQADRRAGRERSTLVKFAEYVITGWVLTGACSAGTGSGSCSARSERSGREDRSDDRRLPARGTDRPSRDRSVAGATSSRSPGACVAVVAIIVLAVVLSENVVYFRTVTEAVHEPRSPRARRGSDSPVAWSHDSIHPRRRRRRLPRSPTARTPSPSITTVTRRRCSRTGRPVVVEGHWASKADARRRSLSDRILIRHGADYDAAEGRTPTRRRETLREGRARIRGGGLRRRRVGGRHHARSSPGSQLRDAFLLRFGRRCVFVGAARRVGRGRGHGVGADRPTTSRSGTSPRTTPPARRCSSPSPACGPRSRDRSCCGR